MQKNPLQQNDGSLGSTWVGSERLQKLIYNCLLIQSQSASASSTVLHYGGETINKS